MKSIITFVVSLLITQSAYAGCGGFGPGGCEFPVTHVETLSGSVLPASATMLKDNG